MANSPAEPLRVVIQGDLVEEFRPFLTLPAELIPAPTLHDEDVAPLLVDADVWIAKRFTTGMARDASRLRLIHVTGAGTNEIDFAAVPSGAVVCNTYGHDRGIAEYVLMSMLVLSRDLLGMDRRLRRGDWRDRRLRPPHPELRGRTLGLIGLGHIGAELARLGALFDMRVIGVARRPDPARAQALGLAFLGGVEDLHRVLAEADFVVVAVPLDERTTGMLGPEELAAMKRDAYLINVARAPVIDEAAMYDALKHRTIAGAALDVWYRYPGTVDERIQPSEYPFHELDTVIMTPHVAGWTDGTLAYRWTEINENIRRLIAGEPLQNVVWTAGVADGSAGRS